MLRILLLIKILVVAAIDDFPDYVYYPAVQQSYKFHRAPQLWSDARDTCRREGANLAMPKNITEVLVLKNILDEYPASTLRGVADPNLILLGFHDMFKEGEYVTDKGESIQYYFHKWASGQPNNGGNNENCGTMDRSGMLNDNPCHVSAVFICQKNKKEFDNLAILQSECNSPDPAYKYSSETDKCYKLHLNPKLWSEARIICQAEGGNLAIINTKAEEDFLVAMFTNPQNQVNHVPRSDIALIGFHDIFREGHYMTVEGDELDSIGYVKWAKGEPNQSDGNENCGSMYISGGLNDYYCHVPAIFFCEINSRLR